MTTLDHFKEDYEKNVGENDLTHLNEVLEKHDLTKDFKAGNFDNFQKRSEENYENRCIHHHTFNMDNFSDLIRDCNLIIEQQDFMLPYHLIILARKG